MATDVNNLPPLPAGFVLGDAPSSTTQNLPPLPEGYVIEGQEPSIPMQEEKNISALGRVQQFLEPAVTIGTSAVAEPIAGIAGIAQGLNPFAQEGAAAQAVESTREALTYQPRTEAGKSGMQAVSEVLQPIGDALSGAEKFLGDKVFEATDSPALAAAAATLPTAMLEMIGVKGGGKIGRATKRVEPSAEEVSKTIRQAAPSTDTLKDLSRQVYKELGDSGVTLSSNAYDNLISNVNKAAKGQGLSARTTPKAAGLLQDLQDIQGGNVPLSELDDLRKVAQGVAKTMDRTEAAIGSRVVNEIDDFLDSLKPNQLTEGSIPADKIGNKYRAARNLWGRARKSELVAETIERAKNRASGFENGLRTEFDKIAKNKKLNKYFTKGELDAINGMVQGDLKQNFAKFLGKFGTLGGRDANVLGTLVAGGIGSATGGLPGFIASVAAGSAARKISQKITRNKADFVDSIVRAGDDGQAITKAYLKAVPNSKRSIDDLSMLLSDPKINVSKLLKTSNKLIKDAAEIAVARQQIGELLGASITPAIQQEAAPQQPVQETPPLPAQPQKGSELLNRINEAIARKNSANQ